MRLEKRLFERFLKKLGVEEIKLFDYDTAQDITYLN